MISSKPQVSTNKAVEAPRAEQVERSSSQLSDKKSVTARGTHSRKHQKPDVLEEFLPLVNKLPNEFLNGDIYLPPPGHNGDPEQQAEDYRRFWKQIEPLPAIVRDYIHCEKPSSFDEFGNPVERTKALLILGKTLFHYARKEVGLLFLPVLLGEDHIGCADYSVAPLDLIKGLATRRIWICPICDKIYWAERTDQPTCSRKCSKVRRSRIQRGSYKETRPHFLKKKDSEATPSNTEESPSNDIETLHRSLDAALKPLIGSHNLAEQFQTTKQKGKKHGS